jgi:hypothetical protein
MYIARLLFCRAELITLSTTVYTSIQGLGYIYSFDRDDAW